MTGMELCLAYWEQVVQPAFSARLPALLPRAAAGLVGDGSECFGFDDALSRDHDWGPGVCIWLSHADMALYARAAQEIYASLPKEFLGFCRLRESPMSAGRVGILETESFYARFMAVSQFPRAPRDWLMMPEEGLAAVTNGRVFYDACGTFSALREALLAYYPEDVRRKKLAAHCARAAQSGQYNFERCMRRGERVAAQLALAQFISHSQEIVFLLNRVYRPYFKWAQRAMRTLPILGSEVAAELDALAFTSQDAQAHIEHICARIIGVLAQQGLSTQTDSFLLPHAQAVQDSITDGDVRALHLLLG